MTHTSSFLQSIDQNCNCRLCSGELIKRFNLKVLNKYNVQYYECKHCRSLQTEKPYWLDEAYSHNLSNLDTFSAQRNLLNLAACYVTSKLFQLNNVIDVGGGDGLLCRLLRDYGINCFVKDKYARPTYAQGFTEPNFIKPDIVLAFEVFEHLSNPISDLDNIFSLDPYVILISTATYSNEESDWVYLAPESGQHIFFYSKKALDLIANKYDYERIASDSFILFIKKGKFITSRIHLSKLLLRGKICKLIRALIVLIPAPGMWKDYYLQRELSKNNSKNS